MLIFLGMLQVKTCVTWGHSKQQHKWQAVCLSTEAEREKAMWDTSHVVFLKPLCWQQHENVSSKQGRFPFLERDRIPAATAAGHSRGFGGAHHPSPEAILTGDSNGDFAPSFAMKSHNRRSQRHAARQQKWHCPRNGNSAPEMSSDTTWQRRTDGENPLTEQSGKPR